MDFKKINPKKIAVFLKDRLFSKNWQKSYSQCGEDLIIDYIFNGILKIPRPSYMDIGANDPVKINNTYLLYRKGCRGICVEPDPELFIRLRKVRQGDTCLNLGIGTENKSEADYFIMSSKTLNTFSAAEAKNIENNSHFGKQKIESIIKVPLLSMNDLCEKFFPRGINLISLDVEGHDLEILKSMDLKKYRPEVFCVESVKCEINDKLAKDTEMIDFLLQNGYLVYADTFINTIFIDKDKWKLN
jgi:FkbM family methyltransferase